MTDLADQLIHMLQDCSKKPVVVPDAAASKSSHYSQLHRMAMNFFEPVSVRQ